MNNRQHEHVRALAYCVCCKAPKTIGLLICWPCHHREKAANDGGYSVETEALIARVDTGLEALFDAMVTETARDTFDYRDRT